MYEDLSMPRSFSSLHATVLHSNVKDAHLTFRKERKKKLLFSVQFSTLEQFNIMGRFGIKSQQNAYSTQVRLI